MGPSESVGTKAAAGSERLSCHAPGDAGVTRESRASSSNDRGGRDSQRVSAQKTQQRTYSSSLVTAQEKHLTQLAAFSPAIAHWELSERDASMALEASSWELRVALLFVDISGFTNLCTRLDIDCLQRHINTYFTQLIDIVVARGGDVLRFAGDAIFCSWSLAPHADDEDLILATTAVYTSRPPRPPRLTCPPRPPRRLCPHCDLSRAVRMLPPAHVRMIFPPHLPPPLRRARARSSSIASVRSTLYRRSAPSSLYTRGSVLGR